MAILVIRKLGLYHRSRHTQKGCGLLSALQNDDIY
jgi:hypothetical protein